MTSINFRKFRRKTISQPDAENRSNRQTGQLNRLTDNRRVRHKDVQFHEKLVVMNLKVGEEIGAEVHHDIDQFIRVESGEGMAVLDGRNHDLKPGYAVVIPAAVDHNIVNTSNNRDLKLYTIYTPPEHPAGTVHHTKAEADAAEH